MFLVILVLHIKFSAILYSVVTTCTVFIMCLAGLIDCCKIMLISFIASGVSISNAVTSCYISWITTTIWICLQSCSPSLSFRFVLLDSMFSGYLHHYAMSSMDSGHLSMQLFSGTCSIGAKKGQFHLILQLASCDI